MDGKVVSSTVTSETNRHRFNDPSTFLMHFPDTLPHQFKVEYVHRARLFGAGLILNWVPDAAALRKEAVDVASRADIVIALLGLSPNLEGEEMSVHVDGFSGGDRTKITLPQVQQQLLDALFALHKPVIVVLMNGSALAIPAAQQNAAAILEAWYPGEAGGQAIADTLLGTSNPAGRLPVTFYQSEDQLPPFSDYSMAHRTYRYFAGEPLYPFGYGLSYSTFRYSHITLSKPTVQAGEPVDVDADLTNTSTIAGDEVAELYLRPPVSETNPIFTLQSYERISLQPGETRHLHFRLADRQLSTVDSKGVRSVAPGQYRIYLGGSLPAQAAQAAPGIPLTIAGPKVTLQP
jgi:beta-glucosidase